MKSANPNLLPSSRTSRTSRAHSREFYQTSYERFNDMPKYPTGSFNSTPGPGFYNIPISSFDKTRHSHSIQNRTKINQPSDASSLSFYDVNYDSILPHNHPMSIGKSQRDDLFGNPHSSLSTNTPGPSLGQPETLPANPIKIGVKLNQANRDNVSPGPARYNPKTVEHAQLVIPMKNSKSKREVSIFSPTSDVPGPGSYDTTPPLPRPKRWAAKLKNVKPIPVCQLKRTIRMMEQKKLRENQILKSTF